MSFTLQQKDLTYVVRVFHSHPAVGVEQYAGVVAEACGALLAYGGLIEAIAGA